MAKEVAIFLPATSPSDVVEKIEAYIDYLQDYTAEIGPLPPDIKSKLSRIIENLKEIVEV